MKWKYLSVIAFLAFALSACSTKTPSCSDPESVSLVKQLFGKHADKTAESVLTSSQFKPEQITSQIKSDVANIRTSGYDKAIGKYTCQADIVVSLPSKAKQLLSNSQVASRLSDNEVFRVEGENLVESITYTVQLTDDKKHVYVEIPEGGSDVAEAAIALVLLLEVNKAQSVTSPGASASEDDPMCPGIDTSSTVGLRECIGIKFKASDANLNSTYKKLMATLSDSEKAKIKSEQREWIKQQKSKCDEAGKEFEGGTFQAVAIDDCYLQTTEERLSYLRSYGK